MAAGGAARRSGSATGGEAGGPPAPRPGPVPLLPRGLPPRRVRSAGGAQSGTAAGPPGAGEDGPAGSRGGDHGHGTRTRAGKAEDERVYGYSACPLGGTGSP